jgi:GT2 family glycosyltransferase
VIVVDNGSTDRTLEIVKSFDHTLTLKVLKVEKVHISALRNRGAADARGKFLAFLDSDCLAPSSWLASALHLLENCPFAVLGAHYDIPDDATWVGRIWTHDRFGGKTGDVTYVPAGDLVISRKAFQDIGGFDESIQTNEDIELCARARAAGFGVRAYPELRVTHLGTPRTLLAFYRKQRWHGTHVFKVFLKDPNKRRNRRPVFLALYTAACIAGMLMGAVFGAVGASWAISAAFVVLLVLPLTLLAVANSARRRRWQEAIPLTLIYLSFAIARARALANYDAWKSDSNAKASPTQPSCKTSSS